MAEGLCRAFRAEHYQAYSAGIQTHGLNPNAVKVMAEMGIDISDHESKTLDVLKHIKFDEVITVCAHADQNCPISPDKAKITHVGFDDPPKLAAQAKTEEQALQHYRRVRDEIKVFIQSLPV